MRRRVFAVVLLAAALALPVATGATAADGPPEYTLAQLTQPGDRIPGAAPSQRWVRGGSVWVDYEESNPLQAANSPEWAAESLLRADSVVDANELRLHFRLERAVGERRYNVTVVFYDVEREEYTVETVNGTETRTRRAAANVTRQETTVNVTSSFATVEVPLTPHYDRPRRAAMCVQPAGAAGDCISDTDHAARWSGWTHRSTRASEGVAADSLGDLLAWSAVNVLAPAVLSVVVFSGLGLLVLRRAGAGPRIPVLAYVFVGGPLVFVGLAAGYDAILAAVAAHPPLLGLAAGPVAAPLTTRAANARVRTLLLAQPEVTDATAPTGDEGTDVLHWSLEELPIVEETGSGDLVVAPPGLRPFARRLLGGRTIVEWDARTEVDVDGGTDYDELALLSSSADAPTDFDRGGIEWATPRGGPGAWLAYGGKLVVALLAGVGLANGLAGVPWLGLALPALVALRPAERRVSLPLMSVHERAAAATMLTAQQQTSAAETVDEARSALWTERARGQLDVEDVLDDFDATVLAETLPGDLDVGADGDGPLDDSTTGREAAADGGDRRG